MMTWNPLDGLKAALPYVRLFRGQTFVIKVGGEAISTPESIRAVLEQIATFHVLGIRVVLVHGGGQQATALAGQLGVPTQFVDGRRVTSKEMIEVLAMSQCGSARMHLLAACRSLDLPALGLSGVDAGLALANKRAPRNDIDFGYVGDISSVDPSILLTLLHEGVMPVVSTVCADEQGQLLNVNADVLAAEIAASLGAAKLILVSTKPGICTDPEDSSTLISHLNLDQLDNLQEEGLLTDGMLPKASSIKTALTKGVERVHLVSYSVRDSLLLEVFTNEGCGTLVVREDSESPVEALATC